MMFKKQSAGWVSNMAKYMRIKRMIIKFLEDNGPMNTRRIYEYINDNDKHGIQITALSNVLARNPEIIECHTERVQSLTHSSYTLIVWKAKNGNS